MTQFLRAITAVVLGIGGLIVLPFGAGGQDLGITNTLIVGTQEVPPFAMKRADGTWEGISIDLWRSIAERLHLRYEFREMLLDDMINGVASNHLDAAVAAITITADRQQRVHFTHSYYTSGLAIAVRRGSRTDPMVEILGGFLTSGVLRMVLVLLLVTAAGGVIVWWLERKVNHAQFGGRWWEGLGSGFWWSAAALTTTGYGDKTPQTFAGRVVAVLWTFAGLVIISGFIAAVTASITVRHFNQFIRDFEDLRHHRVAVVAGTTSEAYLRLHRIAAVRYSTDEAALAAVINGNRGAFVMTPRCCYIARTNCRTRS